MNETMVDLDRYVDEVRRGLADLDAETCDELTEGLNADLAELVEERGSGALPRPEEYAAELRASAGLPAAARRPLVVPETWRPALDVVLAALPAWWVARAWVWVMLLHLVVWDSAESTYDVPWLPTSSAGAGVCLWAGASVLSIQMGRGRVWPGGRRGTVALVILALLNIGTVMGSFVVYDKIQAVSSARAESNDQFDVNPDVVMYQGGEACVLQVFDADGKRVRGGYVWDATGQRRLPMNTVQC
jgi:hypothetical protein